MNGSRGTVLRAYDFANRDEAAAAARAAGGRDSPVNGTSATVPKSSRPAQAVQSGTSRDRRMSESCVASGTSSARAVATIRRSAGSW